MIWFGQAPLIGDPNYTTEGLLAMDRWLAAVESDHSGKPLAQKIIDDRPADIQDRCSQIDGVEQVERPRHRHRSASSSPSQTRFGTPAHRRRRGHRDRPATSAS